MLTDNDTSYDGTNYATWLVIQKARYSQLWHMIATQLSRENTINEFKIKMHRELTRQLDHIYELKIGLMPQYSQLRRVMYGLYIELKSAYDGVQIKTIIKNKIDYDYLYEYFRE